jgi:hypothetical protein
VRRETAERRKWDLDAGGFLELQAHGHLELGRGGVEAPFRVRKQFQLGV